jgi:hypothetical protein
MPKNRMRTGAPGAKSVGIRTKHKIGNRKSGRGCNQMSADEMRELLPKVAKRDRNMLRRMLEARFDLPATPTA